MSYPRDIYKKAEEILEKRRDKAVMEADMRSAEIKEQIPQIDEIQTKLSKVGLEISKLFFYKGNTQEKVNELRSQSEALIEERSIILKQHGYSADALVPQYICPVCNDRGFVNSRLCACHRQLLKDIMRDEVLKYAPLDKCTFENFDLQRYSDDSLENSIVPREKARRVLEASRRYAQNFSKSSKNLLFLGTTGLGKTHLSLAIANVVINRGYSVCYGTSQNICDDLQSEQFGRYDNISYTKRKVLDCDLLIFDDLGTEVNNQYGIATVYNIINSRLLSSSPTIVSTNCEFGELLEKYDQRITSRLTGEYIKFYLFGNDIRNM